MKKKNILLMVFPIIAIILELLPNGVTMNWGQRMPDGTLGTIQKHCSFFYAIWENASATLLQRAIEK